MAPALIERHPTERVSFPTAEKFQSLEVDMEEGRSFYVCVCVT